MTERISWSLAEDHKYHTSAYSNLAQNINKGEAKNPSPRRKNNK